MGRRLVDLLSIVACLVQIQGKWMTAGFLRTMRGRCSTTFTPVANQKEFRLSDPNTNLKNIFKSIYIYISN